MQAVWASGDFAVIGTTLQIVGETLCEAADVRTNQRVLDVACGNGNATLAAARRGAHVVGADFVPTLLERAAERAAAERAEVELVVADAEQLPFEAGTFDVVLSTFGVMFTPNHEQAARELVRVCAPGGRIVIRNAEGKFRHEGFDFDRDYPKWTRHVTVTTAFLPSTRAGEAYGFDLQAAGGIAPYRWSSPNLPKGLELDPRGRLQGTLTGPQRDIYFDVVVHDASEPPQVAKQPLVLSLLNPVRSK